MIPKEIKKGHRIAYIINKVLVCEGVVLNRVGSNLKIRWRFFGSHQFDPHYSDDIIQKDYAEDLCKWDENFNGWVWEATITNKFHRQVVREGFESVSTGGGCTAYYMLLPNNHHVLITKTDGDHMPEKASQKCTFGIGKGDYWGEGEEFYFDAPFSLVLKGEIDWLKTIKAKKLIRRK